MQHRRRLSGAPRPGGGILLCASSARRCKLCNVATRLCTIVCFSALAIAPLTAEGVSHYTMLDGNKIRYDSFGGGDEAVVFIHGWTCDSTFWKAQAPIYEQRRSLLIDLPGHGLSDKPEIPYTMELFARAVDAVITDAKAPKATLAAHSMGALVTIQFLRMHSEKVAGRACSTPCSPSRPTSRYATRFRQKCFPLRNM
jgi:pimeloyl-ACP methyl ester carboxylesterase